MKNKLAQHIWRNFAMGMTALGVIALFVGMVWLVYSGIWHWVEPLGWDKGWAGVITIFIIATLLSAVFGWLDWRDSQ